MTQRFDVPEPVTRLLNPWKDATMYGLDALAMKYDNGGRRTGIDRRQFSYAVHIPERRSGTDRRAGNDRRHPWNFKKRESSERRTVVDAPPAFRPAR